MRDVGSTLRSTLTVMLLAYAGAVVVTNILPTRRTLAITEQRLSTVEHENAAHRRMIEASRTEAEALRTDPWTVERILRDELRMSRDGDVVVR